MNRYQNKVSSQCDIVELIAKAPKCTVNCTVESGEHVVHGEHGELSSRGVSKAEFIRYNDCNKL
jgi:hypothetical protein